MTLCPECGGSGTVTIGFGCWKRDCDLCDGIGEIEPNEPDDGFGWPDWGGDTDWAERVHAMPTSEKRVQETPENAHVEGGN